jgi:hypothetical protein
MYTRGVFEQLWKGFEDLYPYYHDPPSDCPACNILKYEKTTVRLAYLSGTSK